MNAHAVVRKSRASLAWTVWVYNHNERLVERKRFASYTKALDFALSEVDA